MKMVRQLLVLCFFLSGSAGLVYQVVWVRMLSLVFGNTVYAVSMVVAAFLSGLALGSHYWGKRVDRIKAPLGTYIKLEVAIALAALTVTFGIGVIDDLIVGMMTIESIGSGGWHVARFLLLFLILLVPTALMGATTPVMGKIYVDSFERVGRGIGSLYAANTYGATFGAFVSGFVLIPLLTVNGALTCALVLNLGIAAALYAFRRVVTAAAIEPQRADNQTRSANAKSEARQNDRLGQLSIGSALAFMAISGFAALAFEILWTRAFVVSFASTVYMFSSLLTVILLGMALGAHLISKRLDSAGDPLGIFGLAQVGIGVLGAASVIFFHFSDVLYQQIDQFLGPTNWIHHLATTFVLMVVALLPPTLLMGIGYPVICRIATRSLDSLGRDVGIVYAVGTAGGIVGSLAAAFIILPVIGLQKGLLMVSMLALVVGGTALLKSFARDRKWWIPAPVALVLAVFIGTEAQGINIAYGTSAREAVVFAKEDAMGTVRVTSDGPGERLRLWVNNYRLAASGDISARFGNMPLLIKQDAKEVLLISLGSGITAGAVGGHPVDRIDCVEIVPALLDAQSFFSNDNHDIVNDKRFKLTFWDGRHYIRLTDREYDLVISDLFQPDSAGVGSLYSLDHFLNVKARLKHDGAMAQWLPLYQLSPENLRIIMRTFAEAFPHVTVWYGDFVSEMPALLLMGSSQPLSIRMDALAVALRREPVKVDMVEFYDPLSFLSAYVMDRQGVLDFTGNVPVNTDNSAVIEYSAPRNVWGRGRYAVENFNSLIDVRRPVTPLIAGANDDTAFRETIENYYRARTLILQGKVDHAYRKYNDEWQKFRQASRYVPHEPVLGAVSLDLGYLFYYNGRYQTAADVLEWSRTVNPNIPQTYNYLAKSYRRLGNVQKATEMTLELKILEDGSARN